MLCFYAAKGGSGCSAVTAAVALLSARQRPTLLVDLNGDLPSILGVEGKGPGLADWFRSEMPPADALHRLEIPVSDRLSLLPCGPCKPAGTSDRFRLLATLLATEGRTVVVDVGCSSIMAVSLLNSADRSVLVTRACYLALRRAQCGPLPDDVVLIAEPGRALRRADVASTLEVPVTVCLAWDPAVARAVDAGLMATRLPRSLNKLVSFL